MVGSGRWEEREEEKDRRNENKKVRQEEREVKEEGEKSDFGDSEENVHTKAVFI